MQLNGFKYSKWLSCSIWPIHETISSTTTPGQSGAGNNGKDVYSTFLKVPELECDHHMQLRVISTTLVLGGGGVLHLFRDAVGVFYSPSRRIYIYIALRKTKTDHIRIINLFPSCYRYWYESITPKNNRTSSDPMEITNTARIVTGGKGESGLKWSEEFSPHIAHFRFFFCYRSESYWQNYSRLRFNLTE